MNIYTVYHFKNLLLRMSFLYGHYGKLRKYRNPLYDFSVDKNPVRDKHHEKNGWMSEVDQNNIRHRDYSSYDEYRVHQIQKYDEILSLHGGFDSKTLLLYRAFFYRRFRHLPTLMGKSAVVLCLGARQGTEVEVLRDLGYKKAIGLDLNPGPDNPFVKQGDFMNLEYPDNSVDMIYSNCVDHAFDLDSFFREHARVLKFGGYAIYDIANFDGNAGAFEAVEWRSREDVHAIALQHYKRKMENHIDGRWGWTLFQK